MAKIVTITNPLTGQPAQVDQLDHTAQQIDDGLNIARGVSNPNLLDNWYFGNPINQRGQTSYTGEGYTIDRWKDVGTSYVTIGDNKITFGNTNADYSSFKQIIENPSQYIGKTLTFSVLGRAISGSPSTFIPYHGTVPLKNELSVVSHTFVFGSTPGEDTSSLQVNIWANNSVSSFELIAAKLELGDHQTLAHQENGVWVLNEIPNYGEQLLRCQRYFQLYSAADKHPAKAVDCRPTMRADPSQSTIVVNSTTYYYNTADL